MATCNYAIQKDFPLVVYEVDEEALKKDLLNDGIIESEEEFNEDYVSDRCEIIVEDGEDWLGEINDKLDFFRLELKDGYYGGIQLWVEEGEYNAMIDDDLDDETARYYWGDTADEIRKRYKQEKIWLIEEMKEIARGGAEWHELKLRGVFSNGEAVYEEVKREE